MKVPFLDLSRQVGATRAEVEDAIGDVLDRGRFVLGPAVERFEERFAAYCGAGHCVGVASGTEAITIALRALGIGRGDEVVTAANTCVPTIAGIEGAGATPVLADVEPATCTLDPDAAAEAVTERTKAIVAVHLYGQCADMEGLREVARSHGLKVVEDAAQAHGAEFRGSRAGTLGDAAAFSFYPTKNLGALGDAGAVVTSDSEVAERARALRSYGERERNASVLRGMNSRLDELQAAVLLRKLPRLDGWNDGRRELASLYAEALSGCAAKLPAEARGRRHVYHLYVVRVRDRDRVRARLAEAGVETLVHYPRPIHRHPAYAALGREGAPLAASEALSDEVLSLPLYPELPATEAEAVAAALRDALERESRQ